MPTSDYGQDYLGIKRMTVLSVRDLRVRYSAKGPEILRGIDFDVQADDFMAIIGPSGAGKSTLIRCINRLVEPTGGEITFLYSIIIAEEPANIKARYWDDFSRV